MHKCGQNDIIGLQIMVTPENSTGKSRFNKEASRRVGQKLAPTILAARSAGTLFRADHTIDIHRDLYARVKDIPLREPLNREESITRGIQDVIRNRGVEAPDGHSLFTYWDDNTKYNPLELFGTLIQYLDYHKSPLPKTVLPPEGDAAVYIEQILAREAPATLDEQLDALLDVTNNNIVGALNLGFITSRFMARGLDTKAYPNIEVDHETMFRWGQNMAQFEVSADRTGDSSGDTYYFWTHAMAGLAYNLSGKPRRFYNRTFEHGTDIMRIVREKFTKLPITSDHHEASEFGRKIGLALARPDWYACEDTQ